MNIVFILLFVMTVFIYTTYWTINKKDKVGYHVIDIFSRETIEFLLKLTKDKKYHETYDFITTHPTVTRAISSIIGPDYEFQDYMLTIKKSSISGCHRDENGQFFNKKLKHPAYTIIIYLKEIDGCLDIIENSHEQSLIINYKKLKSIQCVPGQAILFDSDMIHSGSLNATDDSTRIQLKLHHKDDEFPKYLGKMYKTLDASKGDDNNSTLIRNMSCALPIIPDLTKNGHNTPDSVVQLYKDLTYGKGKYRQDDY